MRGVRDDRRKSTDRKVLQIIEERIIYEIKRSSNPIRMFDLFSLVYHHQTCDLELFNYALNLLTIKSNQTYFCRIYI